MPTKPLVLITGASSGIGAATARKFGKLGYPLALLARRKDRLELLKKELNCPVSIFEVDVCSQERVAEAIASIEKDVGPIDILVNNAGGAFGLDVAYESDLTDWEQCIDVNIKGLLYCTRAVLPSMVKRSCGHIINMGSIAGSYAYPGGNVYGAAKAFVHHFSLNLRADLLGTQVRVSCIEPGLTGGSEFSAVRFKGDQKKANKVYENTNPLLPEDIAEVVYFCTTLPPHANINTLEIMPTSQASGPLSVYRTP